MQKLTQWLEIQAQIKEKKSLTIKGLIALITKQFNLFNQFSETEIYEFNNLDL